MYICRKFYRMETRDVIEIHNFKCPITSFFQIHKDVGYFFLKLKKIVAKLKFIVIFALSNEIVFYDFICPNS